MGCVSVFVDESYDCDADDYNGQCYERAHHIAANIQIPP